ncbi:MAG: polysaccharide deacetylase [Chloroflexota bacterium]
MPNSTICLTFDFDALSVWFGYKNTTPAMLARGEYGATVGVPRILKLLKERQLPATFFIPGHTIDSFPEVVHTIIEAGHEVAHHSYSHIDPSLQTPEEERADMERGLEALARVGVQPTGFRSPSGDYSTVTLSLLEAFGFVYDSSLMSDDFRPYHPRVGDEVAVDKPLKKGRESAIWEIPMSYEFDDWVHFQYNFTPYRNGTASPKKVLEIWTADFDFMQAHVNSGILTVAMHPQVIGRGHRIQMLHDFIDHCQQQDDVTFSSMNDVVEGL